MPTYSIIIPHYQTPELLMRCLGSIPLRGDVQVIVVDDCSPGGENYPTQYPQLRQPGMEFYRTSQGGSAGRARNVGLAHARGEWILFADADDYYAEGFLEVLDRALRPELDILYFDVDGQGERARLHQRIFRQYLSAQDPDEVRYHIWTPWNKVLRRAFIMQHGLQFEEVMVGNDAMFCLQASRLAQHYDILPDRLYCLTDREGSLSFQPVSFSREFAYAQVRIRITRFMEAMGLQYRFGYHVFSVPRLMRFGREYGWGNALRYLCHVSRHYGILRALLYNRRRKAYEAAHPESIYCD